MATKRGDENFALKCQNTAKEIRESIIEKLYMEDENIFKGNLEGKIPVQYGDGSIVEAINFMFSPQDHLSEIVINTIEEQLKFQNNPPAYTKLFRKKPREDNLFINLRIAIALTKTRNNRQAQVILDKIMTRSQKYGFTLPQKYVNDKPAGPSPMIGRGAANIILYYNEKSN